MCAFMCVCLSHCVGGQITVASVSGEESIAIRSIEFWDLVCEVEIGIARHEVNLPSKDYAGSALPVLVPLMTTCLTKQVRVCVCV